MNTRGSRLCWRLNGRLGIRSLALLVAGGAPAVHAQAVVSYQQQHTAGWARTLSTTDNTSERRSLGVAGTNVQPLGGSDSFTLRSHWQLREQGESFALEITDVNPEIRIDESNSKFHSAFVQRSASLVAAPTGPLSEVIPIVQLLPGITLTVFTDP